MNKKILLISASAEINPLININREIIPVDEDGVHYPLGLGYLYSVLEKEGYDVRLLFLTKHSDQECFEKIKNEVESFRPDIVGFQMQTFNRVSSYRMIEFIHKNYPGTMQIAGGIHATAMYRQLLEKYPFLIVVIAEGEKTIIELLNESSKQDFDLNKIDGIAFNFKGDIIKTKPRELIGDLDSIPFPKHELFFAHGRKVGSIITTRGCPFNCSFCCLSAVSFNRVRMRSVGNIIEEIEFMINKFPQLTTIWIQDDTFFINNQRVMDFCDEIIKRKIKIEFACNGRMKPLNPLMVEKLEQANFKRIFFGLESGDNGMLKNCHKGITQEDAINAFELFKKSKINIYAHLIVGLPGETMDTIKETARLMIKLQKIKYVPNYYPYILIIFPATEVYEIAKKAGSITDEYWLSDKPAPFFTTENSYEKLIEFQEILLDNLSIIRAFFTWNGLRSQYSILPKHLQFIFSSRVNAKNFMIASAKFILPKNIYDSLKSAYHKIIK